MASAELGTSVYVLVLQSPDVTTSNVSSSGKAKQIKAASSDDGTLTLWFIVESLPSRIKCHEATAVVIWGYRS